MNKLILFIALITFQSWTLVLAASYQLQLKNGNELKTSHYWEEGNEIKLYLYGGIVGIPKGTVIGIKPSNANYQESMGMIPTERIVKDQKLQENTKNQTDNKGGKTSKDMEKSGAIDANYYREQKSALKDKLEEALERNREATLRKDQEAKDATRLEIREYTKRIYDLEAELKEKNKGVVPDWWKE